MSETYPPLEDALMADGPDVPDDETERERWRIDGDRTATWALRRMAAATHEQRRLKELADEEIRRITEWRDQGIRAVEHDRQFFEGKLVEYHRTLIDNGTAGITYKLPAGELTARKQPATVNVTNPDALRDFAEGNARLELLRIEVEPDARALAEVLKAGEIIPGVELHEGGTKYAAKPS